MNDYLVEKLDTNGGIQKIYKFENGYGASVICHDGSYGGPYKKNGLNRWEIAPWDEDKEFIGVNMLEWNDDVRGHLNDPEVDRILRRIQQL